MVGPIPVRPLYREPNSNTQSQRWQGFPMGDCSAWSLCTLNCTRHMYPHPSGTPAGRSGYFEFITLSGGTFRSSAWQCSCKSGEGYQRCKHRALRPISNECPELPQKCPIQLFYRALCGYFLLSHPFALLPSFSSPQGDTGDIRFLFSLLLIFHTGDPP